MHKLNVSCQADPSSSRPQVTVANRVDVGRMVRLLLTCSADAAALDASGCNAADICAKHCSYRAQRALAGEPETPEMTDEATSRHRYGCVCLAAWDQEGPARSQPRGPGEPQEPPQEPQEPWFGSAVHPAQAERDPQYEAWDEELERQVQVAHAV